MLTAVSRRLRVLSDPLRLRILALVAAEELTVSEIVRILNCGQSRVSGHLGRLAEEGLVADRREGRFIWYSALLPARDADDGPLVLGLLERIRSTEEAAADRAALAAALAERPTGPPPGTLGAGYLPGRTWEGFAKAVLAMLPPMRIADLGIGTGDITLLLAERALSVVAIDEDPSVLDEARANARRAGLDDRISFRAGDVCDPPIEAGEVDVWLLSQVLHLVEDPLAALTAARERLSPGGRVVVIDLLAHAEHWVRDRLGHRHLGFTEAALRELLESAGFGDVDVRRAARDRKPPHFASLLAVGRTFA